MLPETAPSIVVVDELPWLLQQDPHLEGQLQTTDLTWGPDDVLTVWR